MCKVVSIGSKRDRQIVELLRHFLTLAERGDLRGIAVCARAADGFEDMAVAGLYEANRIQAYQAVRRMSLELAEQQHTL